MYLLGTSILFTFCIGRCVPSLSYVSSYATQFFPGIAVQPRKGGFLSLFPLGYKYSPIISSIRAWNNLDSLIREASSINSFKIVFKRSCGM